MFFFSCVTQSPLSLRTRSPALVLLLSSCSSLPPANPMLPAYACQDWSAAVGLNPSPIPVPHADKGRQLGFIFSVSFSGIVPRTPVVAPCSKPFCAIHVETRGT